MYLLTSFDKMIRTCILMVVLAIMCLFVEGARTEDRKMSALIFNRWTCTVFDLPSETSKKSRCGPWANACPAESIGDMEFVGQNALTENPLFVKQICLKDRIIEEVEFKKKICSTPFKISVLFNKTNFTFDFGYEIFVSRSDENAFAWFTLRQNFIPPKKLFQSMDKKSKISKRFVTKEFIRFIFGEENAFKHDENMHTMGFNWISVFELKFDFKRWTPKRISYEVRNNNRWPVNFFCKNYDLAEGPKDKNLIYIRYSEVYQEMTFGPHILPDKSSSAACDNTVCVKQWLLIPIDQFHFGSLKETSCPHMATVPIWKSTLELVVMKVDKFLYALFNALGSGLHVVSGTSGQLKLTKKTTETTSRKKSQPKSDIYLDMLGKNIPVPEIIYKLVKYKLDDCPRIGPCWYSAIVVIHNNPYFDPKNKICPDVTAEWGWTEVTKFNLPGSMEQAIESKYVYVCKSDQKLLHRLMGSSANKGPRKMRDFDLFKVLSNGAKEGIHNESIAGNVLQKLQELAERERKLKWNHLNRVSEAEQDNITDEDSEDVSERNRRREDADVIDEGIKDDDDGEIKPAARYGEERSHDRKMKQPLAGPEASH